MRSILLTIAILFATTHISSLFAQDDDRLNREVVVEIEQNVEIDSADRNYDPIREPRRQVKVKDQEYGVVDYQFETEKVSPTIRVFRIKPPDKPELYKHFVKGGFGNYVSPYLELFTSSSRDDEWQYNAHYKHYSSVNGPVDGQNSGQSLNELNLYGKRFIDEKMSLSLSADYVRMGSRFYGYAPEYEDVDKDSIKQVYNHFNSSLRFDRQAEEGEFGWKSALGYSYIADRFDASEGDVSIEASPEYHINDHTIARLKTMTYISQLSQQEESFSRFFFRANPELEWQQGRVRVNAGARIIQENDTIDGGGFHMYPSVLLDVLLVKPPGFRLYGGLDGDMERNTLQSYAYENPFINQFQQIYNTNNTFRLFGGMKATILEKVTFDAGLSFLNYNNLYFFVNDPVDRSKFNIIYDDGNTTRLRFDGELMYNHDKKLRLGLKTSFNSYNTSSLPAAFHRPQFESALFGTYNLFDKVFFQADISYISGIDALDRTSDEVVRLDPIIDLNLKADFRFTKRLSSFVELNNILSNNYVRYQYYPVQGINVLLGLTYSF